MSRARWPRCWRAAGCPTLARPRASSRATSATTRSAAGRAGRRELIRAHVRRGSRIAVFGDYDVDGVCSTAIMLRTLRALGADPAWELPSRFGEGYGLSAAAVERLRTAGADLLITVDCAITAVDEVAAARRGEPGSR